MNELIDINGTPHPYRGKSLPPISQKIVAHKKDVDGNGVCQVLCSGDGQLFNPLIYNGSIPKKDRDRGGEHFKLTKCSADCYRSYVTFLRSKNRTHFVLAQRRLLDGYR